MLPSLKSHEVARLGRQARMSLEPNASGFTLTLVARQKQGEGEA